MKKLILFLLLLSSLSGTIFAQFPTAIMNTPAAVGGYETETNAYLTAEATAGATFTTAQKDSINRFFKDLKGQSNPRYTTYNVYSRIIALYPYLGGTAATCAVNAVLPGTYDLTHTGSPTFSSTGCVYNGTSQYSNTGFTPPNTGSYTSSELSGWGIHRRDANNDANATFGIASSGNTYAICRSDNFRSMLAGSNNLVSGAGTLGVNALWAASYSASGTGNAYRNGVLLTTSSVSFGNCGNQSVYIGAFHGGGGPGYGGANTIDFAILLKDLWSNNEQLFLYNAMTALNSSFGR